MNRRDVEELGLVLDPGVEYHSAPELPGAQVHHGADATKAFLKLTRGQVFFDVDASRKALDQ